MEHRGGQRACLAGAGTRSGASRAPPAPWTRCSLRRSHIHGALPWFPGGAAPWRAGVGPMCPGWVPRADPGWVARADLGCGMCSRRPGRRALSAGSR